MTTYDPRKRKAVQRGPGPRLRRRQVRRCTDAERIAHLERWNRALVEHAYNLDNFVRNRNLDVYTEKYEPRLEQLEEQMEIVEELLEVRL